MKRPGDRVEQVVDMSEDVIAVGDGIDDDAEGVEVIELVDGFVLGLHLAVDGIDMLDAAIDADPGCRLGQPGGDLGLDGLHEAVGLGLRAFK